MLLCFAACRAVCCCPPRFLLVVVCCFVRAGWCCVLWPVIAGCLWLGLVARCCALSRVLLPGRMACCPAVCCGMLWCPAPLCCVLRSVVLSCRVVPCCGALLCVLHCWHCWFASCPCVCGAVLRCAPCCSVPVWSVLLLLPRAVLCHCVLCCLPWRSMVCCGVLLCRAVFYGALLPCGAVLLGCAVCSALLRVFFYPFKKHFLVFENINKQILFPTQVRRPAAGPFWAN